MGTIVSTEWVQDGIVLGIDLNILEMSDARIGDSIAVNGVCLTLTKYGQNLGYFDVSPETLSKCLVADWKTGDKVNLERALTLQKPLGGHLVSGHVDGTAQLTGRTDGETSTWMQFLLPRAIGRYIAIKGSVTVDGISLTSNKVNDEGEQTLFELTLVPHTLSMTTLGDLLPGSHVHIEIDLIARYLERMSVSDKQANVATVL